MLENGKFQLSYMYYMDGVLISFHLCVRKRETGQLERSYNIHSSYRSPSQALYQRRGERSHTKKVAKLWMTTIAHLSFSYIHIRLQERQLEEGVLSRPQSTQSDDPVRFLIFCSISISLLASLVAGRRPQCSAGPS
jgi:hypothetical protein